MSSPAQPSPCNLCGRSPAPFGYRVAGPWTQIPPERRKYLWACADPACKEEAEQRKARADMRFNPARPEVEGEKA